jgi:hypothetical protein
MRSYVRYAAAACAASMLVLAGCASEPATPASPNLAEGSLTYAITPAQLSWTRIPNGPMPKDSLIALISGLIAVGGYPQFGAIQYSGGPSQQSATPGPGAYGDWLDMSTRPNLSRSPLGWRFVFKLKPNAASFPIGRYIATIPVTVGGASNNPQSIVVVFNHCDNCLFVDDYRDGELTAGDPRWNWSNTYNNSGNFAYDDWSAFVPPFTTVAIIVEGGDCLGGPYNHQDNTLTAWTVPGLSFVDGDDDGYCSNDPIIFITNSSPTMTEYLVRASGFDAFGGSRFAGTYRIHMFVWGGGGYTLRERTPDEPGDKPNVLR